MNVYPLGKLFIAIAPVVSSRTGGGIELYISTDGRAFAHRNLLKGCGSYQRRTSDVPVFGALFENGAMIFGIHANDSNRVPITFRFMDRFGWWVVALPTLFTETPMKPLGKHPVIRRLLSPAAARRDGPLGEHALLPAVEAAEARAAA